MDEDVFEEDPRYKVATREAIILLILFVFNVVWWAGFAYGLGSRPPSEYSMVFGFPDWFFYSSVLSWVVFTLVVVIVVKLYFKEVSFESETTMVKVEENAG